MIVVICSLVIIVIIAMMMIMGTYLLNFISSSLRMPYKIHTPSHVQGAEPRHALGLHVAEELREDVRALLGTPVAA